MTRLDYVANLWWTWILSASWQLGLFICIVAAVSWSLQRFSARLRYGLWLLVLVKVFLPPTLTAPWSLGTPVANILPDRTQYNPQTSATAEMPDGEGTSPAHGTVEIESTVLSGSVMSLPAGLTLVWAAGCICLWAVVGVRYFRLARTLAASESIDEGPLRIFLEESAQSLKLKSVPELLKTNIINSPFLFGVVRPRVVIPQLLIEKLSTAEMRAVLMHEATHWKRRDTWVGWFQVIAQGLFWFHPLVWWANNNIRQARESACDEMVLQHEHCRPQQYGEAILRTLTASRGRSLVAGNLVGVFERGANIQNRLEEVMNYEPGKRQFGWIGRGVILLFAALFLPMAASIAEPVTTKSAEGDSAVAADDQTGDKPSGSISSPVPQIVQTMPKSGAKDVDPAIDSITVTFDRSMQKGVSWTGGPPHFPPTDKTKEPHWKDDRTCVLPVRLEQGRYYRLGINSKSFKNFKSSDGTPAAPSVLYFVTKGATKSTEQRVRVPQVVEFEPENGGKEIDPTIKFVRVTFDVPMGKGMSWTGGGPTFPDIPDNKGARWSRDGKTCTLPVNLKPNVKYQLGLNSLSHNNFQSKWGVPLQPVPYEFTTRQGRHTRTDATGDAVTETVGQLTGKPQELKNDDGKPAGKKSFPRGIASAFKAPGNGYYLNSIRIHGGRYGFPQAPQEDFHVSLCDRQFKLIRDFTFPYAKFKRGAPEWVLLQVKPTAVPEEFVICLNFNPERTKGVYVSHDAEGRSLVGLPGKRAGAFTGGDWMIRPLVDTVKPE